MASRARAFDNVYDPIYTVSGARDHYRASQYAMMGSVERVPDQANMFSELQGVYPAHNYKLAESNPLPAQVDASFRPSPHIGLAQEFAVQGANRHKYFRRPVVPFLHSVPPEVLLAPTQDGQQDPMVAPEHVEIATKKTVSVQTMYRESEAQTDPYTPDYTVRPGAEPEILTLATLSHGQGLPAGRAEVEMIERARQKREFENSLPPTTDEASFELRRAMMEEQEMREWSEREKEIDRLQGERLQLLKRAIYERERENEMVSEQRIEDLRSRKLEEMDRRITAIQQKRIKVLRKLSKAHKSVLPSLNHDKNSGRIRSTGAGMGGAGKAGGAVGAGTRRDIIAEYDDFSSRVYAPVLRSGQFPDRHKGWFEVHPVDLQTTGGLAALEASLPASMLQSKVGKPDLSLGRTAADRSQEYVAQQLEAMEKLMATGKLGKYEEEKPSIMPSWRRRAEKTVRPATPTATDGGDDGGDARSNAIVLLQKLIRGRAVQNMMYEGKDKRLQLIRELRTSEVMAAEEAALQRADSGEKAAQQMESALRSTADTAMGEVVSTTLDFLAKELVRRREEARISALVSAAEETRRVREAEESGRRQAEEQLRAREDGVFRQVLRVHQGTVDSYLQEVVGGAIEEVASSQALASVSLGHHTLAPMLDGLEEEGSSDTSVVRDLVASFLLPEVQRQRVKREIENEERRFVEAAHRSIYDLVEAVENEVKAGGGAASGEGGAGEGKGGE